MVTGENINDVASLHETFVQATLLLCNATTKGQESNFELFQLIFFTFPPIQMLIFDFEVETCIEIAACNSDMNKSHCGSVSVFNLVNRMHRSFSGSY